MYLRTVRRQVPGEPRAACNVNLDCGLSYEPIPSYYISMHWVEYRWLFPFLEEIVNRKQVSKHSICLNKQMIEGTCIIPRVYIDRWMDGVMRDGVMKGWNDD